MKIIVWDALEQYKRRRFIDEISKKYRLLKQSKNIKDLEDADVILKHDTLDQPIENSQYIITYHGGSGTKVDPIDEDKNGFISYKLLRQNLEIFLKHIQDKEQLTKEDFNSLFGFDPHQEASIRLWKSLDLLAVKKRKNNETEYRDELEEIKGNVNKGLLDVDLESFDLDSDMEDLYKQLFPQN